MDKLYGSVGEDVMDGGSGDDYLVGSTGDDTYIFGRGYGIETIVDDDQTDGNMDTLQLDFASGELVFAKKGNDLTIEKPGAGDQVTLKNWFRGSRYQLERLEAQGSVLYNTQVEQLIQSMASLNITNGAQWSIALNERPQEVQNVLAQFWSTNG
ncbi:calcium-binding protein [Cohnella sp. GCM10027633]|uniref:calcium-binding protein n=1 Tax=unclassified Cohnella TaxID=2636738 RepID=UPI00362623D9